MREELAGQSAAPTYRNPGYVFFRSAGLIGSLRIRIPLAAKIALQSAGATGGRPGSPIPPTDSVLGIIYISTLGISSIVMIR
jgi:hypothetical protein